MKNIKYFVCFLALIALSSCNPDDYFNPIVEVKLPQQKPKLVVFSEMWEGQDTLTVFLTQSRNTLDNKPFPSKKDSMFYVNRSNGRNDTIWYFNIIQTADIVADAKVELFKNEALIATFAKGKKEGFYTTKLAAPLKQDGATYRLQVSAPNFETVEATQKLPTPVAIDTVIYRPNVRLTDPSDPLNYFTQDEFGIEFKDPAGEKNYYTAEGFVEVKNGTYTYSQYLNLHSFDPISSNNFLQDASFDGKKAIWREHTYPQHFQSNNKITIYLTALSAAKYTYQQSLSLFYNAQDNPFAEPVVLYTNIKNGYGLFAMGSFRSFSFKIK